MPHLTAQERQMIRVGMSATVEIVIQTPPKMVIPISALNEKNGDYFVQVYDPTTHRAHDVLVQTEATNIDSVVIVAGIKRGDKIVLPH